MSALIVKLGGLRPRFCKTHDKRICETEGCTKLGKNVGKNKDGTVRRERLCSKHRGIKNGHGGWDYKIYRKDYCENIDGRLGFICTTTIIDPELQLDADHINGDPTSHRILGAAAIQTLCKCCHAIKTHSNKDYLTDGRKVLGVA